MMSFPFWMLAALLPVAEPGDDIRDITAIEEVPPPPSFPWETWLAVGVGIGFILLGIFVLRKVFRRRDFRSWSPEALALQEMKRLGRWTLPECRKLALLDRIVRGYVQKRFQVPARHWTTQEILPLPASLPPWIEEFFKRSDLIKFAGIQPTCQEVDGWLDRIRQWIGEEERRRAAGVIPDAPDQFISLRNSSNK